MEQSILFLITKAGGGGAQEYVYELARAATKEGYPVAVAYGTPGRLTTRLSEEGVRTIHVPLLARDIRFFDEFRVLSSLVTLLRNERPHTVHLNSSKAAGLGALAARIAGIRNILYTAHGWPHKEPRSILSKTAIWMLSWVTVLLSTKVIVVSHDDFRRAPVFFSRTKLHLIRNGIGDFKRLSRTDARNAVTSHVGHAITESRWLLALGELHRNKGVDILIHAFVSVARTYTDTHLLIMGGGEKELSLRKEVERLGLTTRITFTNFIPNGRSYLTAADLFIFPSRKEGLPFALLEAGIAELPVIASCVGGIPEVITDGETGMLVPSENPEALATAMRTLLNEPERAKRYGTALKTRVEHEFSKERMVRETFALYQD